MFDQSKFDQSNCPKDTTITPALRWGSVCFSFVSLIGMFFVLPVYLTWYSLTHSRHPISPDHSSALWLFTVFGWGSGSFLLWEAIKSCFLTKFDEKGVWQRHLLKWEFVSWESITCVKHEGFAVAIIADNRKILVTPTVTANWREIANFIKSHTTEGTFKISEGEINAFE